MSNMEQEVQRFKMELLRKMPFYGDVLMHLVFAENKNIPTAATDGKTIWYNPKFLSNLHAGERNFVISAWSQKCGQKKGSGYLECGV